MKNYVLSALVDNNPGVLSRVCQLFNRRGYNLESVTAGTTENEKLSRLTLIANVENENVVDQIIKQMNKIEDIHKVCLLQENDYICKQITLIKVKAVEEKRTEIINLVNIFRVAIVDVTPNTLTIEITGDKDKIDALKGLLKEEIIEIVSSGYIAIQRGNLAI